MSVILTINKYGILPKNEYTNNEIMKCVGVLLGVGILSLLLVGIVSRNELSKNRSGKVYRSCF